MFRLYLYHVDVLNQEYCSGWCFHRLFRRRPVNLDFFLGDQHLGGTTASLERKDLHDQSLHPDGICGFEFPFPRKITADNELPITIRPNHGTSPMVTASPEEVLPVLESRGRPSVFMHIPKTAGTSFNNHIPRFLGYRKAEIHVERLDEAARCALFDTHDYISGHLTLEKIRAACPDLQRADLHSMLRDPYRQLHSHLAWIKGIGASGDSEFFRAHQPVVQSLARSFNHVEPGNLGQLQRMVNNLDGFEIDFFDNIQTRYFLDYRPDRVDEGDLDNAVANLELFRIVGITEQYNAFTRAFSEFYGMPHLRQQSRHNPSKVPPLFDVDSAEVREVLAPLVCHDSKLYQAVCERLERTGAQPGKAA